MKLNKNIGVIALISPSTIPQLANLCGEIDSHAYEIREAMNQWESFENMAAMMRRAGLDAPEREESRTLNPLIGKETYLLCGYANYLITGKDGPLGTVAAEDLPFVTYSSYIERHKYPNRFFRLLEFQKEMQYGLTQRAAFGIVAKTDFELTQMLSRLVQADIVDSYFSDLRFGLEALNGGGAAS